ncbi:MAG: response regulator [Bacteroidetes bacterium]|nr:response regulator [Fibrella sp.]
MSQSNTIVYMADDDADDRYFMRKSFQAVNPSVTLVEAEDGIELLTLLDTWSKASAPEPVHLILLDMNMPKANGLETLIAIKSNPLLRHIPAVMISTSAEPEQVATAYQHGISSYIKKSASSSYRDQIARAVSVCFLDTSVN